MEKINFSSLLKNHEKKHKIKPAQFISVASGVQKRLETNLKYRKSSRLTVFDSIRNLSKCESPAPVLNPKTKVEHRRQQLEKWKEEKEKRKKEAASQKKKPFVAGIPHASMKFELPPPPKAMASTSGRVTRSQSAKQNVSKQKIDSKPTKPQSFAPKNASFQPPKNLTKGPTLAPMTKSKRDKINYTFKPILPGSEKQNKSTSSKTQVTTKASTKETRATCRNAKDETDHKKSKSTKKSQSVTKKTTKTITSSSSSEVTTSSSLESESSTDKSPVLKMKTPRRSLLKVAKQFTPKNPVPKSESTSEERLRSPKSSVEVPTTPEQNVEESNISPCVTMSRGKDNARREMKKKMEEGLLDDDAINIDSIVHFRQQLQSEIKRMTEMCEVWDKIQEQTVLSDSILESVLGAVGQARLLMAQKLQQFAQLVERCARPRPGDALVTPADLQGFWDMVFMQIENIDMRFKKLEEIRARGWVEDAPIVIVKKSAPKNVAKKPVRAASGTSRIKEMIAAARKAKKEQETTSTSPSLPVTTSFPEPENKTFEAGFFCVRSPVRSASGTPTSGTPTRSRLLKAVLSSEANKSASKNAASFAMLRASVMSKNIDTDGIALLPPTPSTLTPINPNATPARSILKSTNVASEKKSKKSIKVVLFDEADDTQRTRPEDNSGDEITTEFADSGISSMDVEKETEQQENKENNRKRGKLVRDAITQGKLVRQDAITQEKIVRQDAITQEKIVRQDAITQEKIVRQDAITQEKIVRQDAITQDSNQVMTRSRRKSMNTPAQDEAHHEKTPRKSLRKMKALQVLENVANVLEDRVETPKRSLRTRKSSGLQSGIKN